MILSALLTSVGINLCLCFIFFTLYSILRKQPGNIKVYAPRLVSEGKYKEGENFNLERLLPTAGWVKRAWQPSEEDILTDLGLDAVVFMRLIVFCLQVFTVAGIIGVCVLLPVNYVGTQLSDDSDFSNKSLDSFSISNVNDGSNRLWLHFSAVYVFTIFVCYLLYREFSYIAAKRISYFYSLKPQPRQYTILVRSIPASSGVSYSELVESFFSENYPSSYLSHSVIHRTSKLRGLIKEAEKVYKKLSHLQLNNHSPEKSEGNGLSGSSRRKVDDLDHCDRQLRDLEDNVRVEQSLGGKEVPAAFVSFKSQFVAAQAVRFQQGINPTEWVTEMAPEPHDVYWPFFSSSFLQQWIRKVLVAVAYLAITLLFLIAVVIVQGLANLEQLETWLPFLKKVLTLAFVSQVITGYLPSLILQQCWKKVPPIMKMLSSIQGYISTSQIEKSACSKVLLFTIWNIFFANVLSGSVLYEVNIFLEPKNIAGVLAVAVPAQASFFISYVVTSGWTGLSSELFRMCPLIKSYVRRIFRTKSASELNVPSMPYHSFIPKILLFQLLGITYFFLAPLILPFLLVYYCLGYIIFRNQLFNVYKAKYELGGKFWPVVHYSTIFSLVLMHIIAIGIFGLKKLPLASTLIVPLPILTLLFNDYCLKRFLPIFESYPVECFVKKDKEYQNDPAMEEFYNKLETAYKDPALMPMQYPGRNDEHNTPLLNDTRV